MPRLALALLAVPLFACASQKPAQTSAAIPLREAKLAATDAAPPTRKAIVRRVLASNVRLFLRDGKEDAKTASGVVIATEDTAHGAVSYVLTNAHALDTEGIKDPRLFALVEDHGDVVEYEAAPVAIGKVPEMDLALLRVPGVRLPVANLADDSELEPGEDVVVAAAPFGKPLSVTGGMVSRVEWDPSSRTPSMLKTDAAIGYGASGGGVYSRTTGNLLAIVEGYRTAKVGFLVGEQNYSFDVPMPGETFAAPSAKVRAFLAEKGFDKLVSGRCRTASRCALAAIRPERTRIRVLVWGEGCKTTARSCYRLVVRPHLIFRSPTQRTVSTSFAG